MRIYLDSMVWIYLFESQTSFGDRARSFMQQCRQRRDTILSSHHVLAETLVVPIRKNDPFLINAYQRAILGTDATTVVPFTQEAALIFASIRATTAARPLDAIHLALAASASSDLFITEDTHIQGLTIPGIQQIAGLENLQGLVNPQSPLTPTFQTR